MWCGTNQSGVRGASPTYHDFRTPDLSWCTPDRLQYSTPAAHRHHHQGWGVDAVLQLFFLWNTACHACSRRQHASPDVLQGRRVGTDVLQGRRVGTDELQGHRVGTDEQEGRRVGTDVLQGRRVGTDVLQGCRGAG